MGTLQNVLPIIIQPQSRIFQKGIPMLFSAMQKGHFPFKKRTFCHHFKSGGGGHVPPSYALAIGQHFHNCQHVQYIVNLHFAFHKLYNPTDENNNISAFISNLIIDNSRILHTTSSHTPNFLLLLEAIYIKYHSPSLNTGLKASKELNLFS